MRIHTVAQVFSVMCIASLLYWLRVTLISSHHYIMIYAILLKSLSYHQDTQDIRALFSFPFSPFSNISESTFMRKLVDLIVSVWCGQFTTRAKLHIFSVILFLVSLLRNILNFGRLVKIICHDPVMHCPWCYFLIHTKTSDLCHEQDDGHYFLCLNLFLWIWTTASYAVGDWCFYVQHLIQNHVFCLRHKPI